jgi:hypothetical protein
MKPLLEIHRIPMSIEFKINKAHYEILKSDASAELVNNDGSLEMHMEPVKLNMDTIDINHSARMMSLFNSIDKFTHERIMASYETTSSSSSEGSMMLNIRILNACDPEIALKKFNSDVSFNMGFNGTEYESLKPEDISIRYEFDKINNGWETMRSKLKFIPGSIEFIINEYPRLEINYVGSPIFVPPSADPNYKPVDTFA